MEVIPAQVFVGEARAGDGSVLGGPGPGFMQVGLNKA